MLATRRRRSCRVIYGVAIVFGLLAATAGCRAQGTPAGASSSSTLRVGFGLTSGQNVQLGIGGAVRNITLEGLVTFSREGRLVPKLAESVVELPDGLGWIIRLKPGLMFHDGSPLTAAIVRTTLLKGLPDAIGLAYEDVASIVETESNTLEVRLKRRSTSVLEALDLLIPAPDSETIGTGPFSATIEADGSAELLANLRYHEGRPTLDRISIRPYESVRSAWADMLRGATDMLYEVGLDSIDSLDASSATKVVSFQRPYMYAVILNVDRPQLKDRAFRRTLSSAIDRELFVSQALNGHGRAAQDPVGPTHWANDAEDSPLPYAPRRVTATGPAPHFTCLYSDPSHERLALVLKRMLESVGVEVTLESVPVDEALKRVTSGDFDAWLADVLQGPTLSRAYRFWHSGAPYNWGHYSNAQVDSALDAIRHAPDDAAYKAGVAAFQRAIVDDPPALFLAWSERARAVSTRFNVPVEPGRDILSTLRLWTPAGAAPTTSN